MCGIAGVWHTDGRPLDTAKLRASSLAIRHRGPNDQGYLLAWPRSAECLPCAEPDAGAGSAERLPSETDASVGLAFRRLSILDLSMEGHQPMPDRTRGCWLVFNGEIYNFIELRDELRAFGHEFRTTGDSEVILAAYRQWGDECVSRFNGMFAFAIWDAPRRRLFCARDRFGVKPFYYFLRDGAFAFSSEIKGLLPYLRDREPDLPYLRRFLETGLSDDGARTFLDGVHQLEPAHTLVVENGKAVRRRYWDVQPGAGYCRYDAPRAGEMLRELLTDAVRIRLRSDVPVGSCASGGLDSSAILAIAHRAFGQRMHSFSAVYHEPGYDEGRFVDLITADTRSIASIVTPRPEEWFDVVERMTWFQDGPSSPAGLYTQWHVMNAASRQVTVLLDGQGGDELFAGYFRYLPVLAREQWRAALHGRVSALAPAVRESFAVGWRWRQHFQEWSPGQFARAARQRARARAGATSVGSLFAPDSPVGASAPLPFTETRAPDGLDAVNAALYRDITSTSLPMLLRFEDRNSMAFHLEARTPFLDYRLVEFALAVPGTRKIRHGLAKAFFREEMQGLVPDPIINRRDKMGYPTPFARWLRGPLREGMHRFLNETVLPRGWYDRDTVERRWSDHQAGRHDWSAEIGRWMTAEIWMRQVIEGGRS
jgi:asparagine synthase (glutamine-hydrolysing)